MHKSHKYWESDEDISKDLSDVSMFYSKKNVNKKKAKLLTEEKEKMKGLFDDSDNEDNRVKCVPVRGYPLHKAMDPRVGAVKENVDENPHSKNLRKVYSLFVNVIPQDKELSRYAQPLVILFH